MSKDSPDGYSDMLPIENPPWRLRGEAIVATRWVPTSVARQFVPSHVRVLDVLPGKTLCVVYLSRYVKSPVGSYHECIVAPALVRVGARLGAWVSHIVVDNERSMLAGRAIWALPKHIGRFDWGSEEAACDSEQIAVRLRAPRTRIRVAIPLAGAAMSRHEQRSTWFTVRGRARTSATRGRIVCATAELAPLELDQCRTFYRLRDLHLHIGPPRSLKRTEYRRARYRRPG